MKLLEKNQENQPIEDETRGLEKNLENQPVEDETRIIQTLTNLIAGDANLSWTTKEGQNSLSKMMTCKGIYNLKLLKFIKN